MATASTNHDEWDADLDAKLLSPHQEVFLKPYVEESVLNINYKTAFRTKIEHETCWRSPDNSKILLAGYTNSITVLRDNGREYIYKLSDKRKQIMSGISITDQKQMICIDWKSVETVNITSDTHTELQTVKTLNVNNPLCMFTISKAKYGILCNSPTRVEVFKLTDILLDRSPAASKSFKLNLSLSKWDTACGTKDNTVCVVLWNGVIYQYDEEGTRLAVIGSKRSKCDSVRPGKLFIPGSIQECGDMLIVTCAQGDVHTYQAGSWKLLMKKGKTGVVGALFRKKKKFWFSAFNEKKLWAIDFYDKKTVYVYDISTF